MSPLRWLAAIASVTEDQDDQSLPATGIHRQLPVHVGSLKGMRLTGKSAGSVTAD